MQAFTIAFCGGLGCLARYWVSGWGYALLGRFFPWGTLLVNVLGSFALAALVTYTLRGDWLPVVWRQGLAVGFMGGFTTFSTFAYESMQLVNRGSWLLAGLNIAANVSLCLLAALLGMLWVRW